MTGGGSSAQIPWTKPDSAKKTTRPLIFNRNRMLDKLPDKCQSSRWTLIGYFPDHGSERGGQQPENGLAPAFSPQTSETFLISSQTSRVFTVTMAVRHKTSNRYDANLAGGVTSRNYFIIG
jgi:hypothetical protein